MTTDRRRTARIAPRAFVDIAVLTVLSLIGILGFAAVFQEGSYLPAAIGGLLVGTGVGILAAFLRFGALLSGLLAAAAFYLFGSALAMPAVAGFGVLPNLQTLQGLSLGAVFGWRDIVTLITPVAAPDYIAVLPYLSALLVGLVSASIAARRFSRVRRTPLASAGALIAPVAIYVLSVLVGTDEAVFSLARGVAFAAIALVWMSWRVPEGSNPNLATNRAVLRRRILGVAVVAAVAVAGGGALGTVVAPLSGDRFVLRDVVEPPFDPLLYPSPLSAFRKFTKLHTDDELFTVSGLKKNDLIRIATMDSYDGQLWNVTDPAVATGGSGGFRLVSRELPGPKLGTDDGELRLDVTIDEYTDLWLPTSGYGREIDVDPSTPLASTALRYNAQTGVLVDSAGTLPEGLHYTIDAERQKVPTETELADRGVANISLPPVTNVPDIVGAKAVEFAGDATTPYAKLTAIATALSTEGYLSHGAASDKNASAAGHGADRMKLLLERSYMIGDAEQFASAFALMARGLGYPARVVMGFAPDDDIVEGSPITFTGDDVTAWVEVAFDGVGWVPFFPTPTNTEVPQDQQPKPQSKPQPQVRQPPQLTSNQDELVSGVEIDKSDDQAAPFRIPSWVWVVGISILVPLALLLLPLMVVGLLKRRRRRRRSVAGSADRRAAGAWDELVDVYAELGYRAPRGVTRVQLALEFEDQFREELAARRRERSAGARRAAAKPAPAEPFAAAAISDATVVRGAAPVWRPGVDDGASPLPVLPGLREFAVRSDEAVFSGREVDAEQLSALWREADTATKAAERSVSWLRRRLSAYRYRTRVDVAARLTARVDAARTRPNRGVATT